MLIMYINKKTPLFVCYNQYNLSRVTKVFHRNLQLKILYGFKDRAAIISGRTVYVKYFPALIPPVPIPSFVLSA